jgi:hypothetical protein
LILGGRGRLVRGNYIGVNINGDSLGNQSDGINIAGGQFSNAFGTIGAQQSPWDGKRQMLVDSTSHHPSSILSPGFSSSPSTAMKGNMTP